MKSRFEIRKQLDGMQTQSMSLKLRPYNRARKLAAYIRARYSINTYIAKWAVQS